MNPSWVALAFTAAGACVGALGYALKVGIDVENMKRMLGLANGTKPIFVRDDIAEARYEALLARIDVLQERVSELKTMLTKKEG